MPKPKLGVVVNLAEGPEQAMRKVRELELPSAQVVCWDLKLYNLENARLLKKAATECGVEISSLWAGYPGRVIWSVREGPTTIGIVPEETREARLTALKAAADFATLLGITSITTHVGFIPEAPSDPLYLGVIRALKEIASYCRSRGLQFWFETGQETPMTLLRAIEDVGTDNLGINLDPANLIIYGRANPVDALDVFGPHVRGVHAKDGVYSSQGYELGKEVPLGEGKVNFLALLTRLKDLSFAGSLTIEREIKGAQQIADIKRGKQYLEGLLATVYRD